MPVWRCACLAYREIREAAGSDQQDHEPARRGHVAGLANAVSEGSECRSSQCHRLRHQVPQRMVLEGRAAR